MTYLSSLITTRPMRQTPHTAASNVTFSPTSHLARSRATNANTQKYIVMAILFLTTIVAGAVPILLYNTYRSQFNSQRGQTVRSLLNCFSGGVFLATCLLNILVEGYEEYEEFKAEAGFDCSYPFFYVGIAAGFFLVALIERMAAWLATRYRALAVTEEVHEIANKSKGGSKLEKTNDRFKPSEQIEEPLGGGAADRGNSCIIEPTAWRTATTPPAPLCVDEDIFSSTVDANNAFIHSREGNVSWNRGSESDTATSVTTGHDHKVEAVKEGLEKASNEQEQNRFSYQSGLRAVVLHLALSIHTIFDGLAVGLQETDVDIWTTTAAVTVHKTMVAVSLGLELVLAFARWPLRAFYFLVVFALMAPLGLAVGMAVTSSQMDGPTPLLTRSMLQAVAAGSFLYVTFFEVLAEELGHDSGVLKTFVTMLGFGVIAVAKIWDSHDHDHTE